MVSAAIVVLGLLVLGAALVFSGGRKQQRAASQVLVGDDTTEVKQLLGAPPHRCPTSSLSHLATRFPGGIPRPTAEEIVAGLRVETAARWVYPRGAGCVTGRGDTEIGIDRQGRVLWVVPVTDSEPLKYQGAPT